MSIAAPLTMLLLSATDGMSRRGLGRRREHRAAHFLARMARIGGVAHRALAAPRSSPASSPCCWSRSSVVLWLELLVRDAAIYVVVLMLPLVFATLVWPARRVWATRTAELLFALILSKFAIVAVLSLGGAALGVRELHRRRDRCRSASSSSASPPPRRGC